MSNPFLIRDLRNCSRRNGSVLKTPETEILRIGRFWSVPPTWLHYSRNIRSYHQSIPWFYRLGGFSPVFDSYGVLIYADDTFRGKLKAALYLFDRLYNYGGVRCGFARLVARKAYGHFEIKAVVDIYKFYSSMFERRDANRWFIKVWDKILQTYLRKGKR